MIFAEGQFHALVGHHIRHTTLTVESVVPKVTEIFNRLQSIIRTFSTYHSGSRMRDITHPRMKFCHQVTQLVV